jgi:hypothetical protein
MVRSLKGGLLRLMMKGLLHPPKGKLTEDGRVMTIGLLVTTMFILRVIW